MLSFKQYLLQEEKHMFSKKEFDAAVDRYTGKLIKGGLADNKQAVDFDQEQLRRGCEVEFEHTYSIDIALEISADHLTEDPDYYKKLATIEHDKSPKEVRVKALDQKGLTANKKLEQFLIDRQIGFNTKSSGLYVIYTNRYSLEGKELTKFIDENDKLYRIVL